MNKLKWLIKNLTGEVTTDILVKKGLKVGRNFNRQGGCFLDPSHCFLIEIGNDVTFSKNVTLLAHDASTKNIFNYTKIGKIIIEDSVFIGANVTILPNVVIGKNSIVGAGSIVTKSILADIVVAGNPAKFICTIAEYRQKQLERLEVSSKFDESYIISNITEEQKREMKKARIRRWFFSLNLRIGRWYRYDKSNRNSVYSSI
ncbi:MAG: acyltransferase [Culicoidibacterales bacterium]